MFKRLYVTHKSTVSRTVMCRQDGGGRFPVLLNDLSKCRTNTHKENPNLVRIFFYDMYIEWYIQTVQQITRTLIHKNQFTSLCRGQKPASKCIRLVYEILVICRALQALYTPQRCELMKKKKKTLTVPVVHCLQITGQSRLSGPDSSVLILGWLCPNDNAVTDDIPLISIVLTSMVPP